MISPWLQCCHSAAMEQRHANVSYCLCPTNKHNLLAACLGVLCLFYLITLEALLSQTQSLCHTGRRHKQRMSPYLRHGYVLTKNNNYSFSLRATIIRKIISNLLYKAITMERNSLGKLYVSTQNKIFTRLPTQQISTYYYQNQLIQYIGIENKLSYQRSFFPSI